MSEERDTAPSGAAAPPGAAPEIALPERVDVFDTTLRDGSQFEGISLSVDDKLRIAEQLDYLVIASDPGASTVSVVVSGATVVSDVTGEAV